MFEKWRYEPTHAYKPDPLRNTGVRRLRPYPDGAYSPVPQCHDDILKKLPRHKRELAMRGLILRLELDCELADIDGKTGLLTSRAWQEAVLQQLASHQRAGDRHQRGFIVIADLDHFKSVNDTSGHLVGDRMLRAVGNAASATVANSRGGSTDNKKSTAGAKAGRFGGEEFVFWLPDADKIGAVAITERFKAQVNEIPFLDDNSEPLTLNGRSTQGISIGVAPVDMLGGEPWEALDGAIRNADWALYAAKQGGRDTIYISDGSTVGLTKVPPVLMPNVVLVESL